MFLGGTRGVSPSERGRDGALGQSSTAALVWFVTVLSQACNIDDVLSHHTSFLDNCLKDCMLTNPELLKIFSKLMSVCVMFTNCMQVCAASPCPCQPCQSPCQPLSELDSSHPLPNGFIGFLLHKTLLFPRWDQVHMDPVPSLEGSVETLS